jgi:hypothetical protein
MKLSIGVRTALLWLLATNVPHGQVTRFLSSSRGHCHDTVSDWYA